MDGFVRLFCGCCGMGGDPEPPYSQLHDDSVTPVRDPPLQQQRQPTNGTHHHHGAAHHQHPNEPLQDQGFVNPVHDLTIDATDGPNHYGDNYSDSASPPLDLDDEVVEDEAREKEQLDNIVENTQHSIIAVGQTDVDGVIMLDTQYREKAYKQKMNKISTTQPTVHHHENAYDLVFEPQMPPIQIPLSYDQVSSTISPYPTERMPFSCPDMKTLHVAKPMGTRNTQFLVEHPELSKAGKSLEITKGGRARVAEVLDQIHAGIVGVEVEPRDLIATMDF
uniref:Ragulator complex protein LAMTOR1 n=1 Tax=Caenorhabditis tropicalis TaxID=1561998 RepID=A0A1I7TXL8_9PELO